MPLGFDRSGGRARLAESPLMHAPLVSLVPHGAMSFRVLDGVMLLPMSFLDRQYRRDVDLSLRLA